LVDEITIVIGTVFSGLVLMVVSAFFLVTHRNKSVPGSSSSYETKDYYSQYGPRRAQDSKYSSSSSSYDSPGRRPFRTDAEIEANARRVRSNARTVMIVIMVVALAAVIIAGIYEPTDLILLVFLIPIAISFLWSRRNRNKFEDQDNNNDRR
jgi:Flp pilus assembly protein TadB